MLVTLSQKMSIFNKARAAAKHGKLDDQRTRRAFGILLSKDSEQRLTKYQTTSQSCNCPDRKQHPEQSCKHMIAKMMLVRLAQNADLKPMVYQYLTREQWVSGESVRLVKTSKALAFLKEQNGIIDLCVVKTDAKGFVCDQFARRILYIKGGDFKWSVINGIDGKIAEVQDVWNKYNQ